MMGFATKDVMVISDHIGTVIFSTTRQGDMRLFFCEPLSTPRQEQGVENYFPYEILGPASGWKWDQLQDGNGLQDGPRVLHFTFRSLFRSYGPEIRGPRLGAAPEASGHHSCYISSVADRNPA